MKKLKLSPPWCEYTEQLKALFGSDPDIRIEMDEEDNIVRLYVTGQDKADAISQLLPTQKEYGGIRLYISVIPANPEDTVASLFRKAFDGNPIVSCMITKEVMGGEISYLMFKNRVVQYYNDEMQDPNGNKSTLYHNIANEVFDIEKHNGVFFAVDTPDNLGGIKK